MTLQLAALDAEDLDVISAHMQDALLLAGDMTFNVKRKQFALVANRFAWDRQETRQRRRSGLHFDRVLAVKHLNIRTHEKYAVLSLLAIGFEEQDPPSGSIVLTFSGGGSIQLEVECIEAAMKDLGPAWETKHTPIHE